KRNRRQVRRWSANRGQPHSNYAPRGAYIPPISPQRAPASSRLRSGSTQPSPTTSVQCRAELEPRNQGAFDVQEILGASADLGLAEIVTCEPMKEPHVSRLATGEFAVEICKLAGRQGLRHETKALAAAGFDHASHD